MDAKEVLHITVTRAKRSLRATNGCQRDQPESQHHLKNRVRMIKKTRTIDVMMTCIWPMARSLAAAGITASRCGKALCPARTRRLMAQGASGTRAAAPISPEGTDNTPCLMPPLSN